MGLLRRLGTVIVAGVAALVVITPTPAFAEGDPPSTGHAAPSVEDPTPPTEPPAPSPDARQKVLFNNPWGKTSAQRRIADEYIRLINSARPGTTVRFTIYSLSDRKVADAIIKAGKRGVKTRVIVNRHAWRTTQVQRLRKALGSNRSKSSWVIGRAGKVTHAKYLAVETGQVTVVASQNGTKSGIWQQANDAVVTYGDQALYDALARQFDLVATGTTSASALYSVVSSGTTTLEFFPQPKDLGDPTMRLLGDVTCKVGSGRTKVWGVMWQFYKSQVEVARRLRQLKEQGCDVRMIISPLKTKKTIRSTLLAKGSGKVAVSTPTGARWPHSKYFVIDGYDGAGNRLQIVRAGSANLAKSAVTSNDEIAILSTSPTVVRAYLANHTWMWTRHCRALKK